MSRLPSSAPSCLASSADFSSITDTSGPSVITAGHFHLRLRLRRRRKIARGHDLVGSRHTRPVVAGAEEAADRASFDSQRVGTLEGHLGIIGVAAGAAEDVAGPLRAGLQLHVAEHGLGGGVGGLVEEIAA